MIKNSKFISSELNLDEYDKFNKKSVFLTNSRNTK